MRFSQIKEYLLRSHRELKKVSEKEEINMFYLWYDFIKCSIVHGAIINHYCRGGLYKLKGGERRKSMTYRRYVKLSQAYNNNVDAIEVLNNKQLFNKQLAPYVKRKWLYSKEMEYDQFVELCNVYESLIVKPSDGEQGKGIYTINTKEEKHRIDEVYKELKAGAFMIEEFVKQHPGMVYNNKSVNTLRVYTILDRNGEAHLMKALLRVGTGDSIVDNYHHGGCVYDLDLYTGRITSPSLKMSGEEVFIHPGTDIFMLGQVVPNWDKLVVDIKEAHKLLPGCRYIGWDVAVTQTGIEIIEGNHYSDYELLEFFGVKGWYKKFKRLL